MYSAYIALYKRYNPGNKINIREITHMQSKTRDEIARENMRRLRKEREEKGLPIRPVPLVSRKMEELPPIPIPREFEDNLVIPYPDDLPIGLLSTISYGPVTIIDMSDYSILKTFEEIEIAEILEHLWE